MDFIRLFKVGCHFGQQAVGRNANVYGKAQLPVDAVLDGLRRLQRRAKQSLAAGHVQKGFVNAVLLNIRRVIAKNADHSFDCEAGYQPDNGQNDVTDGSVENYDFDWDQPLDTEPLDDALTDDERTKAQHTEPG